MRKNRLILILCIFSSIVLMIVLSSTIFMLGDININFLNKANLFVENEQQIINSGNFSYGKNIMFLNKQKHINNMEKYNPYLKVINLEIKFPNKLTINCVQRTSLFCVKSFNNNYYIVDEDFKVLNVVQEFINNEKNEILLENITINEALTVGDFINLKNYDYELINSITNSLFQWKNDHVFLKANIKQIYLNFKQNNSVCLITSDDKKLIIKDALFSCSDKFNIAFSAYASSVTYSKNYIYVYENNSGEILCVCG